MIEKTVCIVVPYYKKKIGEREQQAYDRLFEILGKYEIVLATPEGLDIDKNIHVERFSASFFRSIETYSQLMMSEVFYNRFSRYKYILIYQLDAYVFSDRLLEFCELGYDYIGAPLPKYVWYGMHTILHKDKEYYVGNGGFSLRKVNSCLEMLKRKEEIYFKTGFGDYFDTGEDAFWGFCGDSEEYSFTVPPVNIAMDFSLERYDENRFNSFPTKLPFGCHGWSKAQFEKIWRPYIEDINLLSEKDIYFNKNFDHKMKIQYIVDCMETQSGLSLLSEAFQLCFPSIIRVNLWGCGKFGRILQGILSKASVEIGCIFDNKADAYNNNIVKTVKPTKENVLSNDSIIIISTIMYEDTIDNDLKEIGLKENIDYIKCSIFLDKLIERAFNTPIDKVYLSM